MHLGGFRDIKGFVSFNSDISGEVGALAVLPGEEGGGGGWVS